MTLLIYASVAAVLWRLWQADLLTLPERVRGLPVIVSLLLLLAGFGVSAGYWWRALVSKGYSVDWRLATASMGLTVFAKYLPGKVWSILGPSGYVAGRTGASVVALSTLSLNAQLLMIWAGALVGGLGLAAWRPDPALTPLIGAVWLVLSLLLFSRGIPWLLRRLRRRVADRDGLWLSAGQALRMMPWLLAPWLLWCAGFMGLAAAISGQALNLAWFPAFALAATVGILVPVAPGGLGVRETVLAAYLIGLGHSPTDATTLSVASRLWFLIGETAFFGLGWWSGRSGSVPRLDAGRQ